jgi:hypothetical protein
VSRQKAGHPEIFDIQRLLRLPATRILRRFAVDGKALDGHAVPFEVEKTGLRQPDR